MLKFVRKQYNLNQRRRSHKKDNYGSLYLPDKKEGKE